MSGIWFIASAIVCTLVINGVTLLIVPPFSNRLYILYKEHMKIQRINLPLDSSGDHQWWYKSIMGRSRCTSQERVERILKALRTTCFVFADIIVLGIAGALIGFIGLPCIGIPLSIRAVPGLVAFIGTGFLVWALTSGGLLGMVFS